MPTAKKGKQVRFAYNLHTFHSPVTPARLLDTPLTQSRRLPRIGPGPRSYPYAVNYASFPRPHPLLEASAVNWDMMEHSSTITRNKLFLRGRAFHEAATTPPLPFLSISSIHLPWIIDVYASNGSYVSLGDVFNSIYRSLRTNITTTEFNFFPHRRDQIRATRAYEQRYRRFRNTFGTDVEKQSGMKRIDFLMNHTRFHGISKTGHHPDEWQLNVLPLST
jgi:hypothetical protein